jgi:predicted DsbA family dithiol-disulfide isomerase
MNRVINMWSDVICPFCYSTWLAKSTFQSIHHRGT